jgi:coproporphyrinogen III oxidase-like Fe-S oxidoreductase
MMTLDEAIRHYEENTECAEEHRQLAEWLKELKWRRVKMDNFARACESYRSWVNYRSWANHKIEKEI